jgi:hypothetical protein
VYRNWGLQEELFWYKFNLRTNIRIITWKHFSKKTN